MSEKVQALAGGKYPRIPRSLKHQAMSTYQEFERNLTARYEEDAVKTLMPLVVNIQECVDSAYQSTKMNLELFQLDQDQLAILIKREELLRKLEKRKATSGVGPDASSVNDGLVAGCIKLQHDVLTEICNVISKANALLKRNKKIINKLKKLTDLRARNHKLEEMTRQLTITTLLQRQGTRDRRPSGSEAVYAMLPSPLIAVPAEPIRNV